MNPDLPYMTPLDLYPAAAGSSGSFQDEMNYSSLEEARDNMKTEMDRLLTINSVDITRTELSVKQQIAANQTAYDILLPVLQTLESAIQDVKSKWRQR
jgi:hypothetical protein